MNKEEQIQALSKLLLKLLSEDSEPTKQENVTVESKAKQEQNLKTINETLADFKTLGVDVEIVRKIMRRVDEVYGAARHNYTQPLYEDFDRLTGNKPT